MGQPPVFYNGGNAAMANTASGVAHTLDGALNWTVHPLPNWIQYLSSFQMTGSTQAYAVGRNSDDQAILVSTTDGGANWELVYDSGDWPGTFADLMVYEDGRATLVGNYYSGFLGWLGVIVETDDDFQTVSRVDYDDQALWALETPTALDHYALGGPDLPGTQRPIFVFRHGEGGIWVRATLPADIFQISGMTFDSALHGWVVGHFSDANVGNGGVLLETSDGGETWSRTDFCPNCVTQEPMVEEPFPLPNYIAEVDGELFIGQSVGGWPCTTGMCTGKVLTSSDGEQWDPVTKLSGYRYVDLDLASGTPKGVAVGYDGSYWRSFSQTLGEAGWQDPVFQWVDCSFFGACPPAWSEVHIVDDSEVWASVRIDTDPSQLMKSADLATWDFIDTGETISLAQPILSVLSPNSIWAAITTAANTKKIIGTTNGGVAWETIEEGSIYPYTHVAHVSEMQYCIVVRSMACTKNGGVNWSYPSGPSEYTGLQLLDAEYGWSLGIGHQGGLDIHRTIDGGASWGLLAHLDNTALRYPSQMQFVSRLEGWLSVGAAAGGSPAGGLLKTVDGGLTWNGVTDGVFFDSDQEGLVYDIAPDGTGWLASRFSGMMLKTTAPSTIFADGFETGDMTRW